MRSRLVRRVTLSANANRQKSVEPKQEQRQRGLLILHDVKIMNSMESFGYFNPTAGKGRFAHVLLR